MPSGSARALRDIQKFPDWLPGARTANALGSVVSLFYESV
jgi:hypothetical protein